MSNTVTCPSCRSEFEVTEVLAAQLSDRIRAELENEAAQQRQDIEKRARLLDEQQKQVELSQVNMEQQLNERLKVERVALLAQARQAATEELSVKLQDQQSEVTALKQRLKNAESAELELLQRERERERELTASVE